MTYSSTVYSSSPYWLGTPPLSAIWEKFIIDWYWMHNSNLYVIDKRDRFRTDLESYDFPVSHGKWYVSNYYRWRTIELDMLLTAETSWEFNALLDTVRGNLAKSNVELSEKIAGEYRTIKVSAVNMPLDMRYYNITFLKFTVTYIALDPFWYSEDYTSHSFLNMTADTQEEITNQGNVEVEPIITYAYTSASSVTFLRVDIDGIYLQINETITTSDSIIINCIEKTVKHNWVLVEYTWTFPEISTGSNIINFTSDGTYDVDTNILYRRNFK